MESAAGHAPTSISVVVPVYSGEDYLAKLVGETAALRETWRASGAPVLLAELILVDDGAKDGSPALIDALAKEHAWVVALHLSRNYGQHSATVAGILYSSGDWVVTMDEDLQHPPGRIPELLRHAVETQADIVYARPTAPVHSAKARDWTSVATKRLMQWITGNPNIRDVSSFRLLRGEVARSAASVAMHDTYFDVNLTWFSQRIAAVRMALRDERFIRTGRSGYRFRTLVAHAWRMLFSSHIRVLQASTVFGLTVVAGTVLMAFAITLIKLLDPSAITVRGWPSLMVTIGFFGGVIIFMQGVALQYLSTLVLKAHGKPSFFVIDRSRDEELARFFRGGDA